MKKSQINTNKPFLPLLEGVLHTNMRDRLRHNVFDIIWTWLHIEYYLTFLSLQGKSLLYQQPHPKSNMPLLFRLQLQQANDILQAYLWGIIAKSVLFLLQLHSWIQQMLLNIFCQLSIELSALLKGAIVAPRISTHNFPCYQHASHPPAIRRHYPL